MRYIGRLVVLVAIGVGGCSTAPPAPLTSAVAPGQAKLSITREHGGPLASAVHITVNGVHAADLEPGQTFTGGVHAGAVTLTATETMDIGQYTVHFNAVPGKTYSFELTRRTEHMVAAIVGGLAGLVVETAASGEHGGDYKLVPVGR